MARFVARLFSSVVGIAFFVFLMLMAPAYLYFLFKAAHGDHYLAFAVGFILPPIGAVGGFLAWFGAIWHVDAATNTDFGRMLMQQRSTSVMLPLLVRRCGWSEFEQADLDGAAKVMDYASLQLRTNYHFDDRDLAGGVRYAADAAAQTSCDDQDARSTMKTWAASARTMRLPTDR